MCLNVNQKPQFYSYCGNCYSKALNQPAWAKNGYLFHGSATNNARIWMGYQTNVPSQSNPATSVSRWGWNIDGTIVRIAESPSIAASDIVRIGGETTSPRLSVGRLVFSEIARWTLLPGQAPGGSSAKGWWRANDSSGNQRLVGSVRGLYRSFRYWTYVKYHGESSGQGYNTGWRYPPLLELFSDESAGASSSCQECYGSPTGTPSPAPLPSATATPR